MVVRLRCGYRFFDRWQRGRWQIQVSPETATQWLNWIALIAWVLGYVTRFLKWSWVSWPLMGAVCGWLVLDPLQQHYSMWGFVGLIAVSGFLIAFGVWSERSAKDHLLLGLCAVMLNCLGASLVPTLDGSVLAGQYFGILASIAAGLAACHLLRVNITGASWALASVWVLIWAICIFFVDVNRVAVAVSGAAWMMIALLRVPQVAKRPAWVQWACVLGLTFAMQAVAVAWLIRCNAAEGESYY